MTEEKTKYEDLIKDKPIQVPYQSRTLVTESTKQDESSTIIATEDLDKIKEIQDKYTEIMVSFGTLKVEKIETQKMWVDLEEREHMLEQEYLKLQEREKDVAVAFGAKYGQGNLDIKTGKFVKSVQ